MANIKDISTVIASALTELSVNGTLDVEMDGKEQFTAVGDKGEQVTVKVEVVPVEE